MVTVVRDSFGEGGKQKLAKRKLGSVGYVRSSCGMANDPARIKRLRERLMLASSLAEISALASNEKPAKSPLAAAALIDKAPSAVAKLKGQGGLMSALTMGEISAIAVQYLRSAQRTAAPLHRPDPQPPCPGPPWGLALRLSPCCGPPRRRRRRRRHCRHRRRCRRLGQRSRRLPDRHCCAPRRRFRRPCSCPGARPSKTGTAAAPATCRAGAPCLPLWACGRFRCCCCCLVSRRGRWRTAAAAGTSVPRAATRPAPWPWA